VGQLRSGGSKGVRGSAVLLLGGGLRDAWNRHGIAARGIPIAWRQRVRRQLRIEGSQSERETQSDASGVGVEYVARGGIADDRVWARFGGRGKIAVRFKQSGETVRQDPPPRCEGPPRTIRTGFFIGMIRFSGERAYTAVDAPRARGKLRTVPPWRCSGRAPASRDAQAASWEEGRPAVLDAKSGRDGKRDLLSIAASRYPDKGEEGGTRFTAARLERRPRMRIYRFAWAFGTDKTFVCDDELTWATVEPPSPFAGSATFLRGAQGASWAGSLSVELPGVGTVPLAGEGYTARFYWGQPEQSPGY